MVLVFSANSMFILDPGPAHRSVSVLKSELDGTDNAGQFFVSGTTKPQGKILIRVSFL